MCVFETFINHFATLFPRSPSLGFTHISFSAHDYFLLSRVAEIQQFEKALLKLCFLEMWSDGETCANRERRTADHLHTCIWRLSFSVCLVSDSRVHQRHPELTGTGKRLKQWFKKKNTISFPRRMPPCVRVEALLGNIYLFIRYRVLQISDGFLIVFQDACLLTHFVSSSSGLL